MVLYAGKNNIITSNISMVHDYRCFRFATDVDGTASGLSRVEIEIVPCKKKRAHNSKMYVFAIAILK